MLTHLAGMCTAVSLSSQTVTTLWHEPGLTIDPFPGIGDAANRLRTAVGNAAGASTKPRSVVVYRARGH
jgi:hypothetical protein